MQGAPRSLRGSALLWGPRCKAGFGSNSKTIGDKRGPYKPITRGNALACGSLLEPGHPCWVGRRASPASVLERSVHFTSAAASAAGAAQDPASAHPAASRASLDESSSSCSSSCSSSGASQERATIKGPLNVVDTAEEGDILRGLKVGPLTWAGEGTLRLLLQRENLYETFAFPRILPGETVTLRVEGLWPKKGKCKAALLGTELPAPGHRLPPCPHFFQGCSGCQLLHLEYAHQLKAKQQLLHQLLQELLDEQHQHQQSQLQQQHGKATPHDLGSLEPTLCEAGFAARGDFLLKAEGSVVCLGLPGTSSTGDLISVQRCLRLAGPLQEAYKHLRDALLPLLESRSLRPLDPRSGAGCLSGMTLRLAETLAARLPSLKAVTFQDLRRIRQPDEAVLGSDSILMTQQLHYLCSWGTRLAFSGLQEMMLKVAVAVGQAVGTDTRGKRLWTALECGGFFALLLASHFRQVTAFAPGPVDAEETRKNFLLNDLRNAEVVECAGSRDVAIALAARSGLSRMQNDWSSSKQAQHSGCFLLCALYDAGVDVSQGIPEGATASFGGVQAAARAETQVASTSKDDCGNQSPLRPCSSDWEKLSGSALGDYGDTGHHEAPDVLLLTPSRGGIPKAWTASLAVAEPSRAGRVCGP
ncbi:hypothetical protein Emed_006935 [Eimeria media]